MDAAPALSAWPGGDVRFRITAWPSSPLRRSIFATDSVFPKSDNLRDVYIGQEKKRMQLVGLELTAPGLTCRPNGDTCG